MLQALIESNLPKLLKEDTSLFRGILRDLFPHVDQDLNEHGHVQQAIQRAIKELNYEFWPSQAEKVNCEREESLPVRTGFRRCNCTIKSFFGTERCSSAELAAEKPLSGRFFSAPWFWFPA